EYRVVIDPGHGGINVEPVERFGDKYDMISGKFLDVFKEGATFHGIEEHNIMFQIGSKVQELLELTETDEGFEKFKAIVSKYSNGDIPRIIIRTKLSRVESKKRSELEKKKDPNDDYRLFDFPSSDNEMLPGRISNINKFKPHLVLSLHCAESTSRDRIGMNAVISPPYSFMVKGLSYLKGENKDRSFFLSSRYADWFEESSWPRRSSFQWFLSDAAVYFMSFHLDRHNSVEKDKFMGYRHNMVTWNYADDKGWEKVASSHPAETPFADSASKLSLNDRYWDRERSEFEEYRRGGGPEGYGGDNAYASTEIIRFALNAVEKAGYRHRDLSLAPPYISIWSVPLYVNAISAYIELGYIRMPSYRHVLVEMQDTVAEGIAVGVYSLFAGTKIPPSQFMFTPKGKSIDLEKYRVSDKESYFDVVE
ncbi:MAG TPA: hypothetical protein VF857_00900, partial [Spirochaetota bacterium]